MTLVPSPILMNALHPIISLLPSMHHFHPMMTATISFIPLLMLALQIKRSQFRLIYFTAALVTGQFKPLELPRMLTFGRMQLSKCLKKSFAGIATSHFQEKLQEVNHHYLMIKTLLQALVSCWIFMIIQAERV